VKLHFRTWGGGFPLIILHGLLGSLDNWQPLSRRCGAHFKVFAVDQRNHGCSPHSDEFGYEVMSRDLLEFMQTHGLAGAHLLGHSMGGKTAMHFALHHPDLVGKLVVVDMASRAYPPQHAATLEALLALDLKPFSAREPIDAALAGFVPEAELRQFLLKNLRRDPAGAFRWKVNLRSILENYRHLNAALAADRPFSKPALFVRGGKSDYVRDADFDLIRGIFPQAEFQTIPGAGHWVQADAPEAFLKVVVEFLAAGGG